MKLEILQLETCQPDTTKFQHSNGLEKALNPPLELVGGLLWAPELVGGLLLLPLERLEVITMLSKAAIANSAVEILTIVVL